MNQLSFEKYFLKNNICCELVMKSRQYLNILQVESNRLSTLQTECNQLLDKFYILKDEFDYIINDLLPIKYIAADARLPTEEYTLEFSTFARKSWQLGKHRFSEKAKNTKYISIVGSPLEEVMFNVKSFVDDLMVRLTYMPHHSECAATMYSVCNQIYAELHSGYLSTADTCCHQHTYLHAAIPFLQELKGLLHQYLLLPDIHTPKQFVDHIILKIPSISNHIFIEDSEDMKPFRFLIDLLDGKILDKDILDHNSEIKPVVEDDINLKRSVLVTKVVEWIMEQYKSEDVLDLWKNHESQLKHADLLIAKNKESYTNPFGSLLYPCIPHILNHPTPILPVDFMDPFNMHKINYSAVSGSPMSSQPKLTRRGRNSRTNNAEMNLHNDLQPINLHTLQIPLLPPLL